MIAERGVSVGDATIDRLVVKFAPKLVLRHRTPVGKRWRLDETNIKVHGNWQCLYRTVDKHGRTVGFLLTARRNANAGRRFRHLARRSIP